MTGYIVLAGVVLAAIVATGVAFYLERHRNHK